MNDTKKYTVQEFIMQIEQIDYSEIIRIIRPIIIYYLTDISINSYILHRDYKVKNISKVLLPPELKTEYSEVEVNKVVEKKYGEAILYFAKIINDNFNKEDLINFYNNINNLKTNAKNFNIKNIILGTKTAGSYDAKKNEIKIDETIALLTIYHELFHMASSTYKDGIRYSGFSQSSLKPSTNLLNIGNGINEGYTELLAQRYFKLPEISTVAYQYEVLIAERLEQIIGKEKMESLYLNANLKGLIEELKQYAEEDEIMQFIANTDFLLYHMDDKKLQLIKKKLIDKSLKNVNKFLIKCYAEKIKKQSKSDNSNKNGIIEDIANYISSLPSDITMNKTKYEITTVQDINECLTKIFNSNTPFCVELEEKKK